jgi:hypothetical protein
MKVYVCALAKNEHLYINEWVGHYLKLGVDKVFIYDNDDKGTKYIGDFIDKKYLPRVKIINARGIHFDNMQGTFYTNFYRLESKNFDWCLFCDIDEFLVGIDNIKTFLSQSRFGLFNQIRVKWKMFGDDDLIERDMNKGVTETFTKEITYTLSRDLSTQVHLENQGKTIIRGHLPNILFNSVHFANSTTQKALPSCLPSGKICFSGVEIRENYKNEKVFLNHYMTKSLSEFVKQKINRTDAVFGKRHLDMNYYWRINKKTDEKIAYLKNLGLE